MKTILYATDYSDNTVAALRLSHLLSKKFEAKFFLLHVFDMPMSIASPGSVSYLKKEKRHYIDHRRKLKAFCAQHLGDDWKQNDINIIVEEDAYVWNGILEKATKFRADLIVVGTKGASQLRTFLAGSTVKALIRRSACAVLAVPPDCNSMNFRTMVFASDFEQADLFAINRLVKIARKFDAHVSIVHVSTKKGYVGDEQMAWFKDMVRQKVPYGKMDFDLILSESVLDGLDRFLRASGADLLAMLQREDKGLFAKLFHQDTVLRMEHQSKIPLLSYNIAGL